MVRQIFLSLSITVSLFTVQGMEPVKVTPEVVPYVEFLKGQHTSPVDYIFSLFDRYDVIVFGERDHRDTTQYDLIETILADPRFTESVGHIMTESGVNNMTPAINRLLSNHYPHDTLFDRAVIELYRDFDEIYWDKTNYIQLLHAIHRINDKLPFEKKIDLTLLSPAWSWNQNPGINRQQYEDAAVSTDYGRYDIILGENAINELFRIFTSDSPRKKALIILNIPHCLRSGTEPSLLYTACDMIMKRFPGRVANVAVHKADRHTDPESGKQTLVPTNRGKWDAAFKANGYRPVGFDLAGTPFGKDGYDLYNDNTKGDLDDRVTFEECFDGYIFDLPITEHVLTGGIPGFIDTTFSNTFMERLKVVSPNIYDILLTVPEPDRYKEFNEIKVMPLSSEEKKDIERQIDSYFLR